MKKAIFATMAALALGTSVSAQSIEDFYAQPVRIGGHASLGVSGTYGNEKAEGIYYDKDSKTYSLDKKDPFEGYIGVNGNFGGIALVRINNLITFAPELSLRIVDYYKQSDVWNIEVDDNNGIHEEPVDENMMIIGASIPLMVRVTPVPQLYVEAGAQVNLNMVGSFTLDNSKYDYSEDMGDWKVEFFGAAVNAGAGFTLPTNKGHFMEFGLRFSLDLTRLESDEVIHHDANNGTYRMPVETKGWHVQFVYNYFM